jgi:hypothetical protein
MITEEKPAPFNGGSHHFKNNWKYVIVCTMTMEIDGRIETFTEVINKTFTEYDYAEKWSEDHKYGDCVHTIAQFVNPEN